MQYITLSKNYTINEVHRGAGQTGSTGCAPDPPSSMTIHSDPTSHWLRPDCVPAVSRSSAAIHIYSDPTSRLLCPGCVSVLGGNPNQPGWSPAVSGLCPDPWRQSIAIRLVAVCVRLVSRLCPGCVGYVPAGSRSPVTIDRVPELAGSAIHFRSRWSSTVPVAKMCSILVTGTNCSGGGGSQQHNTLEFGITLLISHNTPVT